MLESRNKEYPTLTLDRRGFPLTESVTNSLFVEEQRSQRPNPTPSCGSLISFSQPFPTRLEFQSQEKCVRSSPKSEGTSYPWVTYLTLTPLPMSSHSCGRVRTPIVTVTLVLPSLPPLTTWDGPDGKEPKPHTPEVERTTTRRLDRWPFPSLDCL